VKKLKRVGIDAVGYFLILAGAALGWLPGPGGIPLVLAGLGLLSINNDWARRLREYLLKHGGRVATIIFPKNPLVEWIYDALVAILLVIVTILAWSHAAVWQVSLATALFFIALTIASLNRDRISKLKRKR
jgi:hypothetical protein